MAWIGTKLKDGIVRSGDGQHDDASGFGHNLDLLRPLEQALRNQYPIFFHDCFHDQSRISQNEHCTPPGSIGGGRRKLVVGRRQRLPYNRYRWQEANPEDTLRFHAMRLPEVGMIKTPPNKLIAQGTDWRFLNELKKELKV